MVFIYMNLLKDTQERCFLILYTALLCWDGAVWVVIAAIILLHAEGQMKWPSCQRRCEPCALVA